MLRSLWFRIVYLLIIAVVIYCQLYVPDSLAHSISKSLLMGSLLIAFLIDTRGVSIILKWMAVFAILFSMMGDLLLLPFIDQFLFGLISFLIAHILYIFCFLRVEAKPLAVPFIRKHPWAIFAMILYGGWMFLKLRPGAGELAWAILIYTVAIAVMALTAMNRQGRVSTASFYPVAFGAILFLTSDSVLAWNRFVHPVALSPLWIIGTYGLAQLLIVSGLASQVRSYQKAGI